MSEDLVRADRKLTPANENPWYVLMTLYGEQEGGDVKDRALAEQNKERRLRNRAVWNAWSCQQMTTEEQNKVSRQSGVPLEELKAWNSYSADLDLRHMAVTTLHKAEMIRRNGPEFTYPGFPENDAQYDLSRIEIQTSIFCERYIFKNLFDCFETVFFEDAHFRNATFFGPANFLLCEFEKGFNCAQSYFGGPAEFHGTICRGLANFNLTKFSSAATYTDFDFHYGADFEGATFSGVAHFKSATFENGGGRARHWISFVDCHFEKPANFQRAKFVDRYPNLSGAIFHDRTQFSVTTEYWPVGPLQDLELAKTSCATIRHILSKQGLPEEEHFFFRREMGFAAQIGGWWERLPYRIFGEVSDFGYSIARPALWLLGMFIVIGMINHAVLQWGASLHGVGYHPVQAFALSFSNEFPLFGLQARWFEPEFLKVLNPWLKFLGGLQTVVALPLLFFLGLGLRTRFRMR